MEYGSLNKLGEIVVENGGNKVFVVIDSFLAKEPLNYHQRIETILKKEGLECTLFSDYSGEPTTDHLDCALEMLKKFNADCVVALGGGSAIDLAKAISVFGINAEMTWDEIHNLSAIKRLPLIAIPTTAGTGSEATKVMVVTNTKTNIKMNPGHSNLIPDVAILDPELTLSLPRNFTVYTGLDALAHAMEAYVSNRASMMSDHFALTAINLIGVALPRVHENGYDVEARRDMLLASCYAGVSFSNASTNLAHAAARPLGTRFHIPHGLSVALLLPFVIRFGMESAEERYARIAISLGADSSSNNEKLAQKTLEIVSNYNEKFNLWSDAVKYINVKELEASIPTLVDDAMSGNGIATNRRIPGHQDVAEVYCLLLKKIRELVGTS